MAGRAGIDTAGEAILLASRDNMPALQLRELMVVSKHSAVKYCPYPAVRYSTVCDSQSDPNVHPWH